MRVQGGVARAELGEYAGVCSGKARDEPQVRSIASHSHGKLTTNHWDIATHNDRYRYSNKILHDRSPIGL